MPPLRDLTGHVFAQLTVIRRAPPPYGQKAYVFWSCRCTCGQDTVVAMNSLTSGNTMSCGCLRKAVMRTATLRHGMTNTAEYRTWSHIKSRCENPNAHNFEHYGGRGIRVCKEWRDSFEAFFASMGERPSHRHQIERLDNDGPYSPENCVWATRDKQANNRRSNRLITFNGKNQNVTQWARELQIKPATLLFRLRHGWTVHRALTS